MGDVAEILTAAADLLEKPGAWTQGTWARDADGQEDAERGKDVCWCLYGAIRRAGGFDDALSEDAIQAIRATTEHDFIGWNDAPGRTQAEVVAALREAALRSTHPTGAAQ